MKAQQTKIFTLLVCMVLCVSAYAQTKTVSKLKGIWNYSLPDAPYGYQEGTIEFKDSGEKQTAVVKIQSRSIAINEIKKDGDKYTCSLFVDGSDVDVSFKPGDNKITGTVTADGWEMPITLTPKK